MSTRARTGEPGAATDRASGENRESGPDSTAAVPTGWTGSSSVSATTVVPSRCAATEAVGQATGWPPGAWCTECTAASTPRIAIRSTRTAATSPRERRLRERRRREQHDQGNRPWKVGRAARYQELSRTRGFRDGRKLRRLEHGALGAADVSVGWARGQNESGQGEHRQDPQHGWHRSEETRRTQCWLPIRYTGRVYALGLTARWFHLASSVLLVGAAAMIVMAGRSDRATAQAWERRVLAWAWAVRLVALASGLVVVGTQAALFEDRPAAALEARAIGRVLVETQAGHVWLVRAGFLVMLAAFLSLRVSVARRADWRAARGEAVLLGVAALVPLAAAGHAAAVEPDTARAIAVDALHVLGAGIWAGGLSRWRFS